MADKFQINGDRQQLKPGVGGSMEPDFSAKPTFQHSGETVKLNQNPVSGFSGFKGGEYQVSGDKLKLNDTPPSVGRFGVKMSDRNVKQKKGY